MIPATNARDHGATGDGETDDTAALRAWIAATPEGEVAYLPVGRYKTTGPLTINKTLAIVGATAYAQFLGFFGDAAYASPAYSSGSVIECHATDGAAIEHSPGRYTGLRIEHLAIKGIGDAMRTTTGIRIAYPDGTCEVGMVGVQVSNFRVGLDLDSIQCSHFDRLRVNGCDVGVSARNNTNANVFTSLNLMGCGDGVVLDGAGCNLFQGGTVQGCTRTGYLMQNGADENTLKGIYFENPAAQQAINVAARVGAASVETCHFGTAGDNVLFAGNWCRLISGKYVPRVAITGYGAAIIGACTGTVVDTPSGPPTVFLGDQTGKVIATNVVPVPAPAPPPDLATPGSVIFGASGHLYSENGYLGWYPANGRPTILARPK